MRIKLIAEAVCVTFSTYSAIPAPCVKWDGGAGGKLSLGFLPLVGVVIGAALYGWNALCGMLGIGDTLYAAVASALPVLITGGIHMDGFCDTVDALSSRQSKERKLEILKDSNAGAFAVIYCCVYMLVSFGLFTQTRENVWCVALGYVLSRSLSSFNAVTMQSARKSGMLVLFTRGAGGGTVCALAAVFAAIAIAWLAVLCPVPGATTVVLMAAVTLWYRFLARRQFGGATGDTAGFYLQILELAALFGAAAGGLL